MLTVKNQKAVDLSPVYSSKYAGDFNPLESMEKTIIEPLFNPIISGQPVIINDGTQNFNVPSLTDIVSKCFDDNIDTKAEKFSKELFSKTLMNFDAKYHLSVDELFALQSANKEQLDEPNPGVIEYTPTVDIIPSAKGFIAGTASYDMFFASLAFYARTKTLGFFFATKSVFDDFKTWFAQEVASVSTLLPTNTNALCNDVQNLNLDCLTESLRLRTDDNANNEEFSFARFFIAKLMQYTQVENPALFGVLPFSVKELFIPTSVVLVNVEEHAHATPKQIANEWKLIRKSLAMPINMISNKRLSKLTATAKAMQKMQGQIARGNSGGDASRVARRTFRKTPWKPKDVTKCLLKILNSMSRVASSQNVYKQIKYSFQKPNRRDPDDFNKQGKIVSTKYLPDIHLYIDTSGSISEENYESTIRTCITIAKKLNINLYFNSFSHIMSQCTLLKTRGKSAKAIYAEFQKVPKVTGGTNFRQIWDYINASKKRQRELSLIITDFEWSPANEPQRHPTNLYYMPCSNMDWKYMLSDINMFASAMETIDPMIRKKILA